MSFNMTAGTDDSGRRLDRLLRKALPGLPLSAVHRLLRKGAVLVDGAAAAADYHVEAGEVITVDSPLEDLSRVVPPAAGAKHPVSGTRPAAGKPAAPLSGSPPLEILFEGNGLLFLNKPAGLPVHGGRSLDTLVLSYLAPKLPPSLSFRPGPLHRLDRPTSGVIAFSSSLEGARLFSALMRERKIKKRYLAIAEGVITKSEVWRDELLRDRGRKKTFVSRQGSGAGAADGAIGGATGVVKGSGVPGHGITACNPADAKGVKPALTRIRPLAENGAYTLFTAEIETGRTHQIRAQAAGRGHPLLGDTKYGARAPESARGGKAANVNNGFFLHAWRVELPPGLPCPRLVEAPLPENFQKKIRELFGDLHFGEFQ